MDTEPDLIQNLGSLTTVDFKSKLDQCIHCGMCLSACPTYAVYGTEMENPRGRITMMRAVSEGRFEIEELRSVFSEHIALCLACRACEVACPSGVEYGELIQTTRTAHETRVAPGLIERFVRRLALQELLPHPERLRWIARLMWIYQRVGVQRLIRGSNLLPKRLKAMEAILPPILPKYHDHRKPAPALGEKRGDVAFFFGCIQEAFLPSINEVTIHLLQRNGYQVHFPLGQTCCGAAQLHMGEEDLVRDLARRNIDALLEQDFEAVITNAGGCGATLKEEYASFFKNDPEYYERAKRLSTKVKDICEFLVDHPNVRPLGEVNARATYSDSCHLRNVQKVSEQPRALLNEIPGLQLVELKQPDRCCGSAGVYNIVHPDTADAVLDMKMADIMSTGADFVATSNIGCYMQLVAGARRAGLKSQVVHVVELLDRSYRAARENGN